MYRAGSTMSKNVIKGKLSPIFKGNLRPTRETELRIIIDDKTSEDLKSPTST